MKRRKLLQQASLLAGATLIPISAQGWALRSSAQTNNRQRLIVVFLRGAVDGLNVVVPYTEAAYYEARPTIAIPQPGKKNGAIDLDGTFGLHPALKSLMPWWEKGKLAFVHACGSPNNTRSHFDAQFYMESGTPGVKNTQDGWMNRLLATIPRDRLTQAINVGDNVAQILAGEMPITSLPTGQKSRRRLPLDRPQINQYFDRLYRGNDAVSRAYHQGREVREIILADLESEMMAADQGAPPPGLFAYDARNLAILMKRDARTQLAFMSLGRWDTHVNQGGSQGQLATKLRQLANGLNTLAESLDSIFTDTTIAIVSEFGRTVKENGNRGTDHGHGNVMWLLGDKVRGGRVYGEWPGLGEEELYQGRDLEVTTDFRDVIASVLTEHMEIDSNQLRQIFPNYQIRNRLNLLG